MKDEFEKLLTLKKLLPKEAQRETKEGFYYELHDNGLLKYFAFFKDGEIIMDFGLNEKGISGSTRLSKNYAESWYGNRIEMLTPWNDNSDDSVESDSIYEWASGIVENIVKSGLEMLKK